MADYDENEDDLLSVDSSDESPRTTVEERDEVKEIQKMSEKETRRVVLGRFAVTGALALTAAAITVTTYIFLRKEQATVFETAFDQFARTISESALSNQRAMRKSLQGLADELAITAAAMNATWPFFTMPQYERIAKHTLDTGYGERVAVYNYVEHSQREAYEAWATANVEAMFREAHMIGRGSLDELNPTDYHPYISRIESPGNFVREEDRPYYFPQWTGSPPPYTYGGVNWDIFHGEKQNALSEAVLQIRNETLISSVRPYSTIKQVFSEEQHKALHGSLAKSDVDHPHAFAYRLVFKEAQNTNSPVVAMITQPFAWDRALLNLLPKNVVGLFAVIRNTCGQAYTYKIKGHDAIFQGDGDLHETDFGEYVRDVNLALNQHPESFEIQGHCMYSMDIYPSNEFKAMYDSRTPEIFALIVAATFVLVTMVFFRYDQYVQRRNNKLIENAARSNAVVSQLFPGQMRERILEAQNPTPNSKTNSSSLSKFLSDKTRYNDPNTSRSAKPMAELFLDCTVMFADISGFTAWSSVREPSQVFMLLEAVYASFDGIAKKRRVFKVETIGDCYVAVCGCPEARQDHAVVMARFARDCRNAMGLVVKKLEVILGPDTSDLAIRIGMHSGEVTAGVLRGERARFQLFGDTVNTTARIESTSIPNRIQLSQQTADLLIKAGKSSWVTQRAETINAKGKGELTTYWLRASVEGSGTSTESSTSSDNHTHLQNENKPKPSKTMALDQDRKDRLVDWNVEIMKSMLKQIIARRNAASKYSNGESKKVKVETMARDEQMTVLDEVCEVISLPDFDRRVAMMQQDPESVVLSSEISEQIHDFVVCIATMYNDNPFHNFGHASHVVMSTCKLLSRIVAADNDDSGDVLRDSTTAAQNLHDHTYGITSDPMTQFACVFSALIHDVDHSGVSNAQLVLENAPLAQLYKNRSVAEQNSFDLSWNLLMDERFDDLRNAIFATSEEMARFRSLVVNGVMATDIVDKDLKALRNARWEKAFSTQTANAPESPRSSEDARADVNRKATIVIEHLIQASDVAHTMQHWHVYRKWNENLFMEMYAAFKAGRLAKNPVEFWYEGEKGFFDFYIIPLAKKLKDCGVFGVSSDEYLTYAERNRAEWEIKGEEVVAELVEKINREDREA